MKVLKVGTLTIQPDGTVLVGEDWEFDWTEECHIAGCRAAALRACAHGIEVLGRELGKGVEKPGGGNVVVS